MSTTPTIALKVTRRGDDYHCQLVDDPKVWDAGKTLHEAIGRWCITHGCDFGLTINTSTSLPKPELP